MGLPRVNAEAPGRALLFGATNGLCSAVAGASRAARRAAAEPESLISCACLLRLVRAGGFCASQVRAVVDASEGRR